MGRITSLKDVLGSITQRTRIDRWGAAGRGDLLRSGVAPPSGLEASELLDVADSGSAYV